MPITVHVDSLGCILPDQSLDADVVTAHVGGTLASAVTNQYAQATQHIFNCGSNVVASDPWQGTYLLSDIQVFVHKSDAQWHQLNIRSDFIDHNSVDLCIFDLCHNLGLYYLLSYHISHLVLGLGWEICGISELWLVHVLFQLLIVVCQ